MNERGFMITARTKKRHWFRENEIEITITDGAHTIILDNFSIFTLETNKPLYEQLLFKAPQS